MRTTIRASPEADLAFRGWWMVLWCTLVHGLTAPGQTIGVSAFIDPMLDGLSISRSAISTGYLVGTLTGALALPAIGRWVDRVGIRQALTVVASAFAAVVALTGTAQNLVMLTLAFIGLRMLGQGALSLISATGVALWFDRRRGLALAVTATGGTALMAFAPLTYGAVIDAVGWRWAWVTLGVTVGAVLLPIARLAVVDRPEVVGQRPDGDTADPAVVHLSRPGYTAAEARRSRAFWAVVSLHAMTSALITGLTFHNADVLGDRGLTEAQAAAIFVPQMAGAVAGGFAVGWLSDRVTSRLLLPASGLALGAGILLAATASPGAMALLYGLVTGLALGSISALSSALLPKWFGTAHVGAIRGTATAVAVGASALGPLLLAVGKDLTGSYRPVLVASAIASGAFAVSTAAVPTPSRRA